MTPVLSPPRHSEGVAERKKPSPAYGWISSIMLGSSRGEVAQRAAPAANHVPSFRTPGRSQEIQ